MVIQTVIAITFQVGITAWGDQECSGTKADVFADISKALGFIDWATKCLDGPNTNYFGLKGHERWAKRQYCQNKDRIEIIKNKVSYFRILKNEIILNYLRDVRSHKAPHFVLQINGPTGTEEDNMRRKWLQTKRANVNIEKAILGCPKGPKDVDCNNEDWIRSEEDFEDLLGLGPVTERSDDDSSLDYQAWIRSDLDDF